MSELNLTPIACKRLNKVLENQGASKLNKQHVVNVIRAGRPAHLQQYTYSVRIPSSTLNGATVDEIIQISPT